MNKKRVYGQYNTINKGWLYPQIKEFVQVNQADIVYDPFAGKGDIINALGHLFNKSIGLDIDPELSWETNDSLVNIPVVNRSLIATNPPYLTNYSAKRKKIYDHVGKYFESSNYNDLYLIAIERIIETGLAAVVIIPEIFLQSDFKNFNLLKSITLFDENLFMDTEHPVCVVCIDNKPKSLSDVSIYFKDKVVSNYEKYKSQRLIPENYPPIKFNREDGWLGLRAVDSTNPSIKINFDFKENLEYNWEKGLKNSSRLFTLIDLYISNKDKSVFVDKLNANLREYRKKTLDLNLSPFKGNDRSGKRRRRLDYKTARGLIEKTYFELYGGL